jgi:hypothetical protein
MTKHLRPTTKQELMGPIYCRPPYDLVGCACGDVNCHGWRFVESDAAREARSPGPQPHPGLLDRGLAPAPEGA